jgi:hypothetical protein
MSGQRGAFKSIRQVIRSVREFALCAVVTASLLSTHELRLPGHNLGRRLDFADGTTSRVYRETIRYSPPTRRPALLVVQFRLRLIGTNTLLHVGFRMESILNTVLFAGFPGFRSKLWCTDERTGLYRGVYEWDGAERATSYAMTLGGLLRLVSEPGSVRFHVVPGVRRDDFLRDPRVVGQREAASSERWWRLSSGIAV